MKYTPIFQQDTHRFVVPYGAMVGETQDEAFKIAMGTIIWEGVVMNFKWSGDYLELNDDGTVNVKGWHSKLGPWNVVILDTAKEEAPGLG